MKNFLPAQTLRQALFNPLSTSRKTSASSGALLFTGLSAKTSSPAKLLPLCNLWKVGEEIPFEALRDFLKALGYREEPLVSDKGHFALRRGILDIFPLSTPDPYRIEFFGDQIESIRTFDPIGQKSLEKVQEVFPAPPRSPSFSKRRKNSPIFSII